MPTGKKFLLVQQDGKRKARRNIENFIWKQSQESALFLNQKRGVRLKNQIEEEFYFNQEKLGKTIVSLIIMNPIIFL